MVAKITEYPNGTMIDFGDNVRIEKQYVPVKRVPVLHPKTGQPMMTLTGKPIVTHVSNTKLVLDAGGKQVLDPITKQPATELLPHLWTLYQRVENAPHPDLEGKLVHAHHGGETIEPHTWMFIKDGTKEDMYAAAVALAG